MMAHRLPGEAQVPVRFRLNWKDKDRDVIGYMYEKYVPHFEDKNTDPIKRLMLCLVAYDNTTGEVIKNTYGNFHKDVKP